MKVKVMKIGQDLWPKLSNITVRFDSFGDKLFITLVDQEVEISIGEESFREINKALEEYSR